VLDRNIPLLFRHLERRYTYFQPVTPPPVESLLVPFYVGGKAVGTIWALMHEDGRKFDAEDERLMGVLGKVASSAYQTLASIDDLRFQVAEREKVETALHELTNALETRVRLRTEELEQRNEEVKQLRDQLYKENIVLREDVDKASMFEEIVGASPALQEVLSRVAKVAPTDSTVLLTGETGTGKELVARAIQKRSQRSSHAFVSVNCAAIPTGLLESELFGHEKGAFTGAIAQRIGRFELADGGTVFLDEVGEIPLELQSKLLRVLQEREFERLGSTRTLRTDARLIAATNRDLREMVEQQKFREDLFYRLNVFPIDVPALRERSEDIPLLVNHFTQRFARRMNRTIETIPAETMAALTQYPWPGNIRELQNLIERAVILSHGPVLQVPLRDLDNCTAPRRDNGKDQTLEAAERARILAILKETRWVLAGARGAAARLGMNRSTLQFRLKKLGIVRADICAKLGLLP
jgi:formate hydrogenlyase transcriptional activator